MAAKRTREVPLSIEGVTDEGQLLEKYPSLKKRRAPSRVFPIVVALSVIVSIWYFATIVLNVPKYVLPLPHVVLTTFISKLPMLLSHAAITGFEAIAGLTLAVLIGFATSCLIVWSPPVGRAVMPMLAFIQTTPKVAIAPLLLMWLGFGFAPKIAIAFLISFFPIVVATVAGLKSAQHELIELVRSLTSSNRDLLLRVQIPSALPYFFSGLKIAGTLSLIGALVGEFVGSDQGLGYVILVANGDLNAPMLFAAIVIASLMGFVLFNLVEWIERTAMPWHTSIKTHDPTVDERS